MPSGKEQSCVFSRLTIFLLILAAGTASPAQRLTTLASFDATTTGSNPYLESLVQGLDGNLYGTSQGGITQGGTVFKITPNGTLTIVYNFCSQPSCADGSLTLGGLLLATDGNFYGTTARGGANDKGTVYRVTPEGTLTTLYSFCAKTNCTDGSYPFAGLVQAADGNFYGTASDGGSGANCTSGRPCGTVFKITLGGTLTTLYGFCDQPSCADGSEPLAGLIQATDGSIYGTTYEGGAFGNGTIFRITRGGTLTTFHSFEFDGANLYAGLLQSTDGSFYGTTYEGGGGRGSYGTVFKITSQGSERYEYFRGSNGARPEAGLVQGTDGNLYGTTDAGGSGNHINGGRGTVFKLTSAGTPLTLYSFCLQTGCLDGDGPGGGLVQGTDGNFYGTTTAGGAHKNGTVFSLSLGLGPFVKMLPTSGKVGTTVFILGTNLTGSTAISFDSITAAFTVVSGSEITTTVPTGAISGTVQVTTPGGTLSSNVPFRVTP